MPGRPKDALLADGRKEEPRTADLAVQWGFDEAAAREGPGQVKTREDESTDGFSTTDEHGEVITTSSENEKTNSSGQEEEEHPIVKPPQNSCEDEDLVPEQKWKEAALRPKDTWSEEIWATITIGLPLACAGIAKCLQQMCLAAVLGRHDTAMLAAVSVAAIWTNLTEVMLGSGMGQVMALCSQAMGAKNYKLVATWVHITLVFVTVMSIPFASLRWFTTDVLLYLGVEPQTAQMAGTYTIYAGSVVIFDLWYHTFRVYYASQAIVIPDAINDILFIFVAFAFIYFACFVMDAGMVGAAIAVACTWSLRTIVFIAFCFFMGYHKKTWYTPSAKEIFVWSRWRILIGMLIPAGFAGVAEQAQLQASMLIAARHGDIVAAGHALVANCVMLSFMFAFSTAGATGIRVARFLGEGRPDAAKFASFAGVTLVGGVNSICGILFAIFLPTYARMASHDPLVWEQVDNVRWMGAVNITMLGGMVVSANVIMKQGRPGVVGATVPLFTWGIGLPVSYNLAPTYGVLGISIGMGLGYGLAMLTLCVILYRSDWPRLANLARERAEAFKSAPVPGSDVAKR